MKIAIPLFGSRVSPRFDCAQRILLVIVENKKVVEKKEIWVARWNPLQRITRLTELGIDTVICGGISNFSVRMLISNGMRVISWITGEVEEAIKLFLKGQLKSGVIMGPGGKIQQWRFFARSRRRKEWKWGQRKT
jgi:predicted Fe-Mo cluster-binding NifX family protein